MSYEFLQEYWWLLISVLGALLVFMLFVQGGQSLLLQRDISDRDRELMIGSIAHRWELTFTVLVTFGGAFFASFPLFYSTSFGGAYWIWMLILLTFVIQAVSYKYRGAEGNRLGRETYDRFLIANGIIAPVLLGGAVSTFFYGSEFTVQMAKLTNDPEVSGNVISTWGEYHGLELLANWRVVCFGLMVLFLSRIQALMWFINQIDDKDVQKWSRRQVVLNSVVFLVLFAVSMYALFTATGLKTVDTHQFQIIRYRYLLNLIQLPAAMAAFVAGTIMVLAGIARTVLKPEFRRGIWLTGPGTVLVVLALFWIAGYNSTPFYPSCTDIASSLTIYNSSSSRFTLETMSYVSLAIPFVFAYIAWVWYKLSER